MFQSRTRSRGNNELLVIVTPEIVRPVAADQAPQLSFPSPLGDFKPPQQQSAGAAGPAHSTPMERMPVEQLMQQLKTEGEMSLKKNRNDAGWPGSQMLNLPEASQPPAMAPPQPPAAPAKKQ
jgi:hypothetical protein